IPAGPTHMDGATALRYARTRHQDDDYHRLERQQLVLLAMRDRLLRPDVLPRLPALLLALQNASRTDLAPDEIAALACVGPQIDRSAIQALAIDGTMVWPYVTEAGAQVSIPDLEAIAPVVQAFLSNGE